MIHYINFNKLMEKDFVELMYSTKDYEDFYMKI